MKQPYTKQRRSNGSEFSKPCAGHPFPGAWSFMSGKARRISRGRRTTSSFVRATPWRFQSSPALWRSEEHTSELQSHLNLVCRLLLEKKKKSDEPRARDCHHPQQFADREQLHKDGRTTD